MKATKIDAIEEFQNINSSIGLLGFDKNSKKHGFVPITSITSKTSYCGVRFRKDTATPEGEPYGDLTMLSNLPAVLGLGGYLVQNDHSRRKLATDNHFKFASGGTAALDGTMGHYQWGWNIPWYYSHWEDDTYEYEAISTAPMSGRWNYKVPVASMSASGAAALDRTNSILVSFCNRTAQYRGGLNNSTLDGLWNTQIGKPYVGINPESIQDYAEKNGDHWGASMSVMVFAVGALCRIVFHNRNIQAAYNATLTSDGLHQGGLGIGVDNVAAQFGSQYATCDIDCLADQGDALGVFSKTIDKGDGTSLVIKNIPCFFGLKNFYHYLTVTMHGVILSYNTDKSIDVYILRKWTSDAVNTTNTNGFVKIGTIPSESANWYYIKKMNLDNMNIFPLEFGGSESTYYADAMYHYGQTSGLRALLALGYANNGGQAGLGCFYGPYAPSYADGNVSAFLCEADEDWNTEATWVE
jgi:hypothetical protein